MNQKISSTLIPIVVKEWVFSILKKSSRKYTLNDSGICDIGDGIPWHEADREYFKMFKLENDNAAPTEFSWQNSGMNHHLAVEAHGKCEIPIGHILVKVGIYPPRVTIYKHNKPTSNSLTQKEDEKLNKYIDHITNQTNEE